MKKFIETIYGSSKITESVLENGLRKWIISGRASLADKPNGNNRIYPKAVLDEAIEKMQPKIAAGKVKMCLDHPEWGAKLADCSAILTKMTPVQEDGFAYYEAQITDTCKGKDLKAILDAGGSVGVSTRGRGSAAYDQEWPGCAGRFEVINPGFVLDSLDFVDSPSVGETEDDVHLENKKGEDMKKTLEELRKEFAEAFVGIVTKTEAEVAEMNTLIEASKAATVKADDGFQKLIDSLKAIKPELFTTTTISESEVTKAKDAEIAKLNETIETLKKESEAATAKITAFESEKIKMQRDSQIEKLRADNPDYFKKGMEQVVAKFDACITADEILSVYNANLEIIKSVKESAGAIETPVTKTPDAPKPETKLNEAQMKDFNLKNSQRRAAGLTQMTPEQYVNLLPKK